MEESFRFGRFRGIPIAANWSLLVIFWLVAWNLADVLLPDAAPGYSSATYWVAGIVAAVVFFACLLAHELAHAVVARGFGLPVEGITLWMFGGVSGLGDDPPDARAELRIAVVGPLTSIGLGLGFAASTLVLDPAGDLVTTTVGWMARINLILAVFNLVPAFPLDGGRVLRAYLWRRSGDRLAATERAGAAGRMFGYFLMALGLLSTTAGEVVGGLWFVFLGWFVLAAARAEQGAVEADELLGGVTVGAIMTPDPHTIAAEASVDALLHDHVLRHRNSAYPVMAMSGQVIGIVTLDCIRRTPAADRATTTVGEIAIPVGTVPVVAPTDAVSGVLQQLDPRLGGRVLVVDQGRLVGIVSSADVHRSLQVAQLGGRPELGALPPPPPPPPPRRGDVRR